MKRRISPKVCLIGGISMSDKTTEQEENSQVYLCSGCGGNMEYDIAAQKFKCPYCGNEMDIQSDRALVKEYDFHEMVKKEESLEWNQEVAVVKCDLCGAQTVVDKHETALHCSYCGSSHVLESKQSAGIKPEGIIPFKIDKHKANELFDKWIRSRWLSPNNLKQMQQSDKLISIYVPYWTYDAQTYNTYTAQGGEHYYVMVEKDGKQVQERRTRWHYVNGRFELFFDDVQVNASKSYEDALMNKIEPYDTKQVEPYKPQYLSGHGAERYSRGVVEGFDMAKDKMYRILVGEVQTRVRRRYDEVKDIRIDTVYSDVTCKHVLLPMWTAQYDYNGNKYRYMINGQNGKVSGRSPLSPIKVTLLVVLLIILLGVAAYFYFQGDSSVQIEMVEYYGTYFLCVA